MPCLLRAATFALVLRVASVAGAQTPEPGGTVHRRAANPTIQAFVRQALTDRFAAHDIPDMGMLPETGEVLIRQETGNPDSDLTTESLPQATNRQFRLIQKSVAQARADATGTTIVFIFVGRVVVNGADATIMMGVDTVDRRSPGTVKMCCCQGEARYQRVGDQWKFMRWESSVCV